MSENPSATPTKTIAVIDGNSLMHRAYHAVGAPMTAPDGTPTNAVFGFLSMLLKFIDESKPDAVICAFDCGKPEFRMKALEQYKAQRPPMDQDLRVQFPLMEELLESLHVPVVKKAGWEGDDILGTVSAMGEELGYHMLLVSGDKDVYQLTSSLTQVVTTKKGMTDIAIYGPDEVYERYGVTPAQFPDYLGLRGDTSDNIPGVPGVGEKTAAKLLQQFGSIDGIYENIDKLKGKQRQNVEENREAAEVSRLVATIMRNAPIDLDLAAVSFPAYTAQEAIDAFGKLRLTAHLNHVLRYVEAQAPQEEECSLCCPPIVRGLEALRAVEKAIEAGERVGIASCAPRQATLFDEGPSCAFALEGQAAILGRDEALPMVARIVERGSFTAIDAKEVLAFVYPRDGAMDALVSTEALLRAKFFDCGLAAYVLDSSQSSYDAASLVRRYCLAMLPEEQSDDEQMALAASAARALAEKLEEGLMEDGALEVYRDIDLPLVPVLVAMERVGAAIDAARLAQLGASTQERINDLKSQIFALAGEEFNVDSPKQLQGILFEKMGLKHGKKTQRGYSTDASVLKELAKDAPIADLILQYREMAKIKSTYIDALPRMRAQDGRVHTSFNITVTTTGRLSSSEPNLQNIPVRTDFGRSIRACFVPLRPEDVFVSADYSQIELRLLAHLSQDPGLIAAFQSGRDFHASTAAAVFHVDIDEVTPTMRSKAKAVNFGIVYGQSSFGLAQSLGIPMKEAQQIIDAYYGTFPQVKTYLAEVVEQARKTGYAQTMNGRRRYIPEIRSTNAVKRGFGERTAMNHPMQGSAADIIKCAMNQVQRRLQEEGFASQLLLQVHDELDFSCPATEVGRLTSMVKAVMEGVVSLRVPLIAEVSSGENWAQAH